MAYLGTFIRPPAALTSNGTPQSCCRGKGGEQVAERGVAPFCNSFEAVVALTEASTWLNGRDRSYLQSWPLTAGVSCNELLAPVICSGLSI